VIVGRPSRRRIMLEVVAGACATVALFVADMRGVF
jgi:hypothetical protein